MEYQKREFWVERVEGVVLPNWAIYLMRVKCKLCGYAGISCRAQESL
jgi:hypothetical protein